MSEKYSNLDNQPERAIDTQKVAELNDRLRQTFQGGRVLITSGIRHLGEPTVSLVLHAVRNFDEFNPGNDPYREHDFGCIKVNGIRCFWKIEYYDNDLLYHSTAKDDPELTQRVLTIMLAEEY